MANPCSVHDPPADRVATFRLAEKRGTKRAMTARRPRRPRPPLNPEKLEELALSYVGRFATTRAKLRSYLGRKVRERGWEPHTPPDFEALAERYSRSGLIDDAAFALAKSQSLARRGYGKRRLAESLSTAGVEDDDRVEAHSHADAEAAAAALCFAQRRRIGPFAPSVSHDRKAREKAIAAMVRAGHPLSLALTIVNLAPGTEIEPSDLTPLNQHTAK